MNRFLSSILKLLLSWVRALIDQIWALLRSTDGSAVLRFVTDHWLGLVIGLCLCGMVLDGLIYFFRWRPDYIWASRLHRSRRRRAEQPPQPSLEDEFPADDPIPAFDREPTFFHPSQEAPAEMDVYQPVEEPTQGYDAAAWQPHAVQDPVTYYHDMQSGFAPAIPPEQLYAPSPSSQAPVHPGLDEAAFRQSFGLQTDEEAQQERSSSIIYAPAFHPFTEGGGTAPSAAPGAFSRLARRARSLVTVQDEDNRTIRDLQSTVNVSDAFHAPVYPQPMDHKEG